MIFSDLLRLHVPPTVQRHAVQVYLNCSPVISRSINIFELCVYKGKLKYSIFYWCQDTWWSSVNPGLTCLEKEIMIQSRENVTIPRLSTFDFLND